MSNIFGSEDGLAAGVYREVLKRVNETPVPVYASQVMYGSGSVASALDAVKNQIAPLPDWTAAVEMAEHVTVIAGDSLPHNAYGFGSQMNPADYAYKNQYGMQAWGHMLRDSIYASTLPFTFATDADIELIGAVKRYPNVNEMYTAPFNGNLETFVAESVNDEIHIRTNFVAENGRVRLMFFTGTVEKYPEIAKFDIYANGVLQRTVDLAGDPNFYRGAYQINIDTNTGTDKVVLKNIRRSSGAAGFAAVQLIAFTAGRADVFMNSRGAWTSAQVLADYQNVIGKHAPDTLFLQIGANDLAMNVPVADTIANIRAIITATRTAKPLANVMLITTNPMDAYPLSGPAGQQVSAMRSLAAEMGCKFVNLYDVLGGVSPALWRIDNVHCTIYGGNLVYKAIRAAAYPSMKTATGYFDRAEYQIMPSVPRPRADRRKPLAVVHIDSQGAASVGVMGAPYITASVREDGMVTVSPNPGTTIRGVNAIVTPPGKFYVMEAEEITSDGVYKMRAIDLLKQPSPSLITSRAQMADSYFTVLLD